MRVSVWWKRGAEQLLLDTMLAIFKEQGWLKERHEPRSDSTHVLARVRAINRLMCVGEAMRFAPGSLAIVAGDWLLQHSEEEWVHRYGHRTRVGPSPTKSGRSPSVGRSHRGRWLDLVDRDLLSRRSCEARVRSQLSRFCAASGSKITTGRMVTSVGEAMTILLLRLSSSILPTIKKPAMVLFVFCG
jgi:hypothetical protein